MRLRAWYDDDPPAPPASFSLDMPSIILWVRVLGLVRLWGLVVVGMATGGGAEQRTWIPNRRAPQEEEEEEDHPPTKDDEPPKSTQEALPEIISRINLGLIVPKQQARLLWTHKRSQQNWSLIEICNKLLDEKLAPTIRTTDVMISPHTQKNPQKKTFWKTHTGKNPDTAPMELQSRYTHTESKGATNPHANK
jgi:hypothetical protein